MCFAKEKGKQLQADLSRFSWEIDSRRRGSSLTNQSGSSWTMHPQGFHGPRSGISGQWDAEGSSSGGGFRDTGKVHTWWDSELPGPLHWGSSRARPSSARSRGLSWNQPSGGPS